MARSDQTLHRDRAVSDLDRRVRGALERGGLAPGKLLVVAVSGGPDSLALLHALDHLRGPLDLRLHGAHLDHGLRGAAAIGDAAFVAETFGGLRVPFTLEAADVPSFRRERRLSLEDAARQVRYAFLARVAAQRGADAVALGHTADDQAETVLMHIIRGSGLLGLRGMELVSRRALGGEAVTLVRPMLRVSRQETEEYCRALGLQPRRDESNISPQLHRNRVRLELLPVLERHNPAVREALLRLSDAASRDAAYMEAQVEVVWGDVVCADGDGVTLDRAAFLALDPALQGHLLRSAVRSVKGDLQGLEWGHIGQMACLMAGPAGRSLDLPGALHFSVGYAEAGLAPHRESPVPLPALEGEHRLRVPGDTLVGGWLVTARFASQVTPEQHGRPGASAPEAEGSGAETADLLMEKAKRAPPHVAWFDYDSVGSELWARPRRPGDRFQPLGMSQPKKLQDFMVDAKVPRRWRGRVPLVDSPRGIAWVVGWRVAEWARVNDASGRRLELRFQPRRRAETTG